MTQTAKKPVSMKKTILRLLLYFVVLDVCVITLYPYFAMLCTALKTGWRISKKRVILEFLHWAFMYVDWLLVSCVLIRFILDMAMKRTSFEK